MGTGEEAGSALRAILEAAGDRPVLLDADALTLSVDGGPPVGDWTRRGPTLVTPHPGEMARLTGSDADAVNAARIDSARSFAASTGAVTLLKGAPSVVAHPDGRLLVDAMGSSDLAAAGMGDVLSGVIGALLAQGLPPLSGAGAGLCWSGRSAVVAGKGAGLSPTDVIDGLPEAMAERGPGVTDLDFPFVLLDLDPPR
jgi:hydroxyethylthiazole kinase-like uncharacterized protein yjeF